MLGAGYSYETAAARTGYVSVLTVDSAKHLLGIGGGYEAGVKLVNGVRIFSHLANIGDTRSLIIHPASTTHRQLSDEDRIKAGAGPEVVRLSIGIEDPKDLIADLDQAMAP